MKQFDQLLSIENTLLGENGCPWDREQTLSSLPKYLLEETYELIEAIDQRSKKDLIEEAGDLLHAVVFLAKIGEKEHLLTLEEILESVCEKLIRRHPHIFENQVSLQTHEVLKNWDKIKQEEKKRTSPLEGIPIDLPTLVKTQKIIHRMKDHFTLPKETFSTEEELGEALFQLVLQAEKSKLSAEDALRKILRKKVPESSP